MLLKVYVEFLSLYSKESVLCNSYATFVFSRGYALQSNGIFKGSFNKQVNIRLYSTTSDNSSDLVVFSDADKDKLEILEFVKGKSGIYMWTNKLNNKKYIGSSVNLRRRVLEYYNVNRLLNEKSMTINVALLKYGYRNFSFTVLEFCSLDSLMSKEKYYFEVYNPEYNILNTPGSPSRGSGWKHSEAAKENMRAAAKLLNISPDYLSNKSKVNPKSIKVEVTDLDTNTVTIYHAIRAAARALDIDKRYIEYYLHLNQKNPVLGRYTFKLLDNRDSSEVVNNLIVSEGAHRGVEKSVSGAYVNQKTSQKVEVTDVKTQEVKVYPSIGAAARALGYRQSSISLYLKGNMTKLFKGLHLFKIV